MKEKKQKLTKEEKKQQKADKKAKKKLKIKVPFTAKQLAIAMAIIALVSFAYKFTVDWGCLLLNRRRNKN